MDVRVLARGAMTGKRRRSRRQAVRVHFHVPADDAALRASLVHRLQARFPEVRIEAGQDVATLSFVATLFVQDPRSIFPWLWMFHPHAEVLAGADGLRVRMKQDLEEVLRHYEG